MCLLRKNYNLPNVIGVFRGKKKRAPSILNKRSF